MCVQLLGFRPYLDLKIQMKDNSWLQKFMNHFPSYFIWGTQLFALYYIPFPQTIGSFGPKSSLLALNVLFWAPFWMQFLKFQITEMRSSGFFDLQPPALLSLYLHSHILLPILPVMSQKTISSPFHIRDIYPQAILHLPHFHLNKTVFAKPVYTSLSTTQG